MAQVDPNIQAILDQHQQELTLMGQHMQQQQQHQQQVQQQQQQHQQNGQARVIERQVSEWVSEEKVKLSECDGSSLRTVRVWTRAIAAAVQRVPPHLNADMCIRKLVEATAREDLLDEYEVFMAQQANRGQVTHLAIRAHLLGAFLGPDEANVLKEEVKSMRQAARDDIPRYNRRFAKAAEHAYPLPRNAVVEEELADHYMGSLRDGKIKDKVFAQDPRLVNLQAAMQAAVDEWGRQRRRQRVQRDVRTREEEPMEVNAVHEEVATGDGQPPIREIVTALASSLRGVQKDLQALQQRQTPGAATAGFLPTTSRREDRSCWNCGLRGHLKATCRRPKRQGQAQEQGN